MRPTAERFDVAVIGGGIEGCASAEALTRVGLRVVVVERDRVAAHASGGAAGLLSSRDDETGSPMDRLNRASLALHGPTAARLREETGIDVEYQQEGIIGLLKPHELDQEPRWDARRLSAAELRELEPALAPADGAILHIDDGQVNAARLTRALADAAALRGAEIRQGTSVAAFLRDGDRIVGVKTTQGPIRADWTVLAAGPWSRQLGETIGLTIPLYPSKGEIVWARSHPQRLRRPVFAGAYLVPKPSMGLAIGATSLPGRSDETPSLGGMQVLIGLATAAIPSLADAAFDHVWAGLRPCTPDALPVLGPVDGYDGLLLATGHHAYGIALSLITGELIRCWVTGDEPPVEPAPFRLARFARSESHSYDAAQLQAED
jgi:glycine oxidase